MPIDIKTRRQFQAAIIAQDDDNDYSESGYVAVVVGDQAALASYGHCSCYGTWDSLCGGGVGDYFDEDSVQSPRWDWEGSVDELVRMAARRADPRLPQRDANPEDYNYDHLVKVYDEVIAWDRKRQVEGDLNNPHFQGF